MAKDIFESDYFSKHRDNSSWENRDKGRVHKFLNLKHKPRVEEPINIPEDDSEDVFDEEMGVEPKSAYQSDFMRLVFAGFCGGLIAIVYGLVNYIGLDIFSWIFWKNLLIFIFTGAIIFLLLGLIVKAFTRR